VNAGSVESENGKPSIFFDGTDDRLATSAAVITSTSFSTFSVFSSLSAVGAAISGQHNGGLDVYRTLFTGSDAIEIGKANFAYAGPSSSYAIRTASSDVFNGTDSIVFTGSNNGLMSIGFRGVIENTLSTPAWTPLNTPLSIGSFGGATPSAFIAARIQELGFYPTYQTAYQSISSNMNTYYGSYWQGNGTALLDSFSGASAAYSLRNLSSAYTGPLIRVRRSSDNVERDIFGTFRGDLDLAALTSFVGANSGFVTTWYDQSGLGRNATQTNATSQPRIVNAGAVDTQNGKPAIVFDGSDDILQDSTNNPFTFTGPISFVHASYKNSTTYKSYETLFSAGTTGVGNTNTSRTIGFGYANTSPANPIPSIVTDIWSPSGVQQNGTVGLNQSRIVGYYIPNWSTHRTAGQTSIRSNGVDLSVIPYNVNDPLSLNTNPIKIGGYDTILPQGYFAGSIFEMVAYASNQVASRIQIESNINNYYKIY
jgi:hypothetical protein